MSYTCEFAYSCEYWKSCKKYINSLENPVLPYLGPRKDRCFCEKCMKQRNDVNYYVRGVPHKIYAIPTGWARFGLREAPQVKKFDIYRTWHVAFHGTVVENLESILDCRDLLKPGDVTIDGKVLNPPPGHFTEDHKPKGFDVKQIFVSPTIKYAGLDVYAPSKNWSDESTGIKYAAKVALMLMIKPDSYDMGTETVGLRDNQLDPQIPNSELEWFTKRHGATIPLGIMVKLSKV